jgi:pyroglutamyl-peptidase
MLDAQADAHSLARPGLLMCGFGPFPAAPDNPATRVVEALRDRCWRPLHARIAYATVPTLWRGAAEAVQDAMLSQRCDAVLMIGVAVKARGFRVEMRAQNRTAASRPDASGAVLGRDRIDHTGPGVARATAPVADIVRALRDEGLPVQPSSDAGSYLCNYTLYRVLTGSGESAAPTAGFLHVPQARETAGPDAASTLADIERAVRAAARAFAAALAQVRAPAMA